MKTAPMIECPECEGACEFVRVIGENASGLGGISPIERYTRCGRCDGAGEIPDPDWYPEDEDGDKAA